MFGKTGRVKGDNPKNANSTGQRISSLSSQSSTHKSLCKVAGYTQYGDVPKASGTVISEGLHT